MKRYNRHACSRSKFFSDIGQMINEIGVIVRLLTASSECKYFTAI